MDLDVIENAANHDVKENAVDSDVKGGGGALVTRVHLTSEIPLNQSLQHSPLCHGLQHSLHSSPPYIRVSLYTRVCSIPPYIMVCSIPSASHQCSPLHQDPQRLSLHYKRPKSVTIPKNRHIWGLFVPYVIKKKS